MKKSLFLSVFVMVFALIYSGSVYSNTLNVSVFDDGGNSVGVSYDSDNWSVPVSLTETFNSDSSIILNFSQAVNGNGNIGDITITKEITNSTGLDWLDFHMALYTPITGSTEYQPSTNDDGLYFRNIVSLGAFSQSWYDPNAVDELWLWDGVWVAGQTHTISFTVGGWGWLDESITDFQLKQWPTRTGGPAVPEPATMLLFGAGLLGLAGVSRRKK